MDEQGASGGGRVAWLDYARMASALAVVAFHYLWNGPYHHIVPVSFGWVGQIAAHGYLGVDFFFIISGFVILQSASGATSDRFVVGRLTRLYPAFLLCMLVTFVFRGMPLSDLPAQLTMMPRYFGVQPADGVYWTLAVEMKFYAAVLAVLLLGWMKQVQWLLLGAVLIFACWTNSWHNPSHYLEFAAGCALALIYRDGFKPVPSLTLAIAAPLVVYLAAKAGPSYTSHLAIALVMIAIFALFLAMRGVTFAPRSSAAVGALTYPLYLLHGQLGYAAMRALCTEDNKAWMTPLIAIAAIGCAWAVSRYEAWSRPWWKRQFDQSVGAGMRWLGNRLRGLRVTTASESA
ncbi:peptidoglycan/LPS O-acetylase OafA/YrhL [Caulobacter ginsengisoli]|uniref:Peptidoglycan/LPS O-acetylase OafA/YrhL n=1 Tax=Caulobacter ginsengisoli TaxID=400775 RepID=A0ABU0IPN3_9CAUL|nr:acyltransferase [Caulobacter ginsengisoli]MDQ0462974.1 peptidoglycan/LPS O-acetylase OafA/YrhL [Caulobacter ginsengisoli]